MFKNLLTLLLAAALGLLAGCTTSPLSPVAISNASVSPGSARHGALRAHSPAEAKTGSAFLEGLSLNAPDSTANSQDAPAGPAMKEFERGQASWYDPRFHGRRTASGERYDQHALTAAHKTLPFGTLVRVRSVVTGKEIEVRVNDRGPFVRGRVIDISRAAAESLGMMSLGVKQVSLHVTDSDAALAGPTTFEAVKKQVHSRKTPLILLSDSVL